MRAAVFFRDDMNGKYILSMDEVAFEKEILNEVIEDYKIKTSEITDIVWWLKFLKLAKVKLIKLIILNKCLKLM